MSFFAHMFVCLLCCLPIVCIFVFDALGACYFTVAICLGCLICKQGCFDHVCLPLHCFELRV